MSPLVTLTIHNGILDGKELVFKDHAFCTVGRARDCYLQFPSNATSLDISRHHCLFDIDPPQVRIRDLGSRNGTFVNGNNIGPQGIDQPSGAVASTELRDVLLKNGDKIKVGEVVLDVKIFAFEEASARGSLDESCPK